MITHNNDKGNGFSRVLKYLALVVSLLLPLMTVAAAWSTAQYQLSEQNRDLERLAEQQRIDHDTLTEIRTDVNWIRAALENKP